MDNHYDQVSHAYESSERFGFVKESQTHALTQIQNYFSQAAQLQILELGVGTGAFSVQLMRVFPEARITGLDLSMGMLKVARQQVPSLTPVHGSILDAPKLIQEQFDLLIVHFVLAYTRLDDVLKVAEKLLKPSGVISVCTSTHENYPALREKTFALRHCFSPIHRFFGNLAWKETQQSNVPNDAGQVLEIADAHHFICQAQEQIQTEMIFQSVQEMFDFTYNGGWLVSSSEHPFVPNWLFKLFLKLFLRVVSKNTFPLQEFMVTEIFLLNIKNNKN